MQAASVQAKSVTREVHVCLYSCVMVLRPVLEVCTSSTDLHGESDLIATAIGAMIEVVQKPTLSNSVSDINMVQDALECLQCLTSIPAGRQQALQLLTVDKIEDLLRAALSWLEEDSQPEKHWATAASKATFCSSVYHMLVEPQHV